MLGLLAHHATTYLVVLLGLTGVLFVLPLLVAPLAWGRVMGFRMPDDTDLAVYFGRCLGAFALVVQLMALRAVLTGTGLVLTFDALFAVYALMIAVHVWGAVRGIQPVTETVEIAFWAVLLLLNTLCYPNVLPS